jgi:hypothetical protein
MCYNHCSIQVRRVDGVAVKIEGLPGAQPNYGKTCAKSNAGLMSLYSPGRTLRPLIRTNPEKGLDVDPGWKEISWDEALELATSKLRAARQKDPRGLVLTSFDRTLGEIRSAFLTAFGTPNNLTGSSNFFCSRGHHPTAYTLTGSNDIHPEPRPGPGGRGVHVRHLLRLRRPDERHGHHRRDGPRPRPRHEAGGRRPRPHLRRLQGR